MVESVELKPGIVGDDGNDDTLSPVGIVGSSVGKESESGSDWFAGIGATIESIEVPCEVATSIDGDVVGGVTATFVSDTDRGQSTLNAIATLAAIARGKAIRQMSRLREIRIGSTIAAKSPG